MDCKASSSSKQPSFTSLSDLFSLPITKKPRTKTVTKGVKIYCSTDDCNENNNSDATIDCKENNYSNDENKFRTETTETKELEHVSLNIFLQRMPKKPRSKTMRRAVKADTDTGEDAQEHEYFDNVQNTGNASEDEHVVDTKELFALSPDDVELDPLPCLADIVIPGPIPDDLNAIMYDHNLLRNFFGSIPDDL